MNVGSLSRVIFVITTNYYLDVSVIKISVKDVYIANNE
jgi:hypothetical protein